MPLDPTLDFTLPGERLRLLKADPRVASLAGRLWHAAPGSGEPTISLDVEVVPGPEPEALPERRLRWTHGEDVVRAEIAGLLEAVIGLDPPSLSGKVAATLLAAQPSLAARYLLEAPMAVLLARRGHMVLHAGAVTASGAAVVLRGGSGAGKSTLVAACWSSGLGVLGDESLLACREDPDFLLATVRDLTLLPDSARLAGVEARAEAAFSGGEEKRRIDLFTGSSPIDRLARRAATVLIGPRAPGPARLVPLEPSGFLDAFEEGSIPEERRWGSPLRAAEAWARRGAYRLDGAADLPGAVALIRRLVENL